MDIFETLKTKFYLQMTIFH